MGERQLEEGQEGVRAIRDFAEKAKAYAEAMHLHIDEWGSWEWKKDGSGLRSSVPSMQKIEAYFVENLACLECKGLKFLARPLADLRQHGTIRCPVCQGTGFREFD